MNPRSFFNLPSKTLWKLTALSVLVSGAALAQVGCAKERPPSSSGPDGAGGEGGGSSSSGSGGAGGDGPCFNKDDCTALDDACNEGNCVNAACVKTPKADGLSCDDGKSCTVTDVCTAGVCSGPLKVCPSPGPCTVGVCDVATDTCIGAPGNEGGFCVDDDPCTAEATCENGQCVGTTLVDCSFLSDWCTVGVCDSSLGCVTQPVNDGLPCDDGLFCTSVDVCSSGACSGAGNPCAPPGNPCLVGSCDEFNQSCSIVPGNNGAACDDKNLCTTGEVCGNGLCGGGAPDNAGSACDDKDSCTPASTCDANGVCVGSSPIVQCIAGDTCCPAGCTGLTDADCVPVELIVNGDFSTNDLTSWSTLNNPNGDNDTISTFTVDLQVAANEPSMGPSARVLMQSFTVPPQIGIAATFSMSFFQDPMSPLDPQNVLTIEKDPFDQAMDGAQQNAFRVDIIDPTLDPFTAPILYTLYTPVSTVGSMNVLAPVTVADPSLLTFLQANAGTTLRLRIAQVESTFPWSLQIDDVSLVVQ